jgi:hypothetical protein
VTGAEGTVGVASVVGVIVNDGASGSVGVNTIYSLSSSHIISIARNR